ncbi:UDP-N-acetylglucosamine 2-epimerase [Kordia sp.]|uniref:UDP-N-acetylglucosamine 2-epimerase n=1 Tax=Kordia sp. TaxID=1965332 RepID=UPI003D2E8998
MNFKYLLVTGVRPQYIKAAGLVYILKKEKIQENQIVIYDTGQHFSSSMSKKILKELDLKVIKPKTYNKKDDSTIIFTRSLSTLVGFIEKNGPFKVIVFGDANPTLIGSLAAYLTGMPLIHIEAGARRKLVEFEHYNSLITDVLADLKLCLTTRAYKCLIDEKNSLNVIKSGDIFYEYYQNLIVKNKIQRKTSNVKKRILISLHRPYNSNYKIYKRFFELMGKISYDVMWIIHPRNKRLIKQVIKNGQKGKTIKFIKPLSHIKLLEELSKTDMVITDSGGLAREAYYFRKPILMRRDNSGWPELKTIGCLDYITSKDSDEEVLLKIQWGMAVEYESNKNIFNDELGRKEGIKAILNIKKSKRIC